MKTFNLLADLYQIMDAAYTKTALQYDFICQGCADNCCRSLFFHHTFVEKAYLLHGFEQMSREQKKSIRQKAGTYVNQTFSRTNDPKSLKIICPLNEKGQCVLYPYRPMICRLHGLPHELHKPGTKPFMGPGCIQGEFDKKNYILFDRTPFYIQMSKVEMAFRQQKNKTGKIRETVAQMLAG